MAADNYTKYDEDFISLYHNGKTQAQLCREYGVSESALSKWVKLYSTVQTDTGEVLTAKQVKELQKQNAQLEEENLILKKAAPLTMLSVSAFSNTSKKKKQTAAFIIRLRN